MHAEATESKAIFLTEVIFKFNPNLFQVANGLCEANSHVYHLDTINWDRICKCIEGYT